MLALTNLAPFGVEDGLLLGTASSGDTAAAAASVVATEIFPPSSAPQGVTYPEWTEKYWQWNLGIPIDRNPTADNSGRYCEESQPNNAFFLTGTIGSSAERTCSVPAEKSIVIPVINVVCTLDPILDTEEELRTCAKDDQDKVSSQSLKIDGVPVTGLENYRVQSGFFDLNVTEKNIFNLPPGPTKAVSDGTWVILKNNTLSPGSHVIEFNGNLVDYTEGAITNFATGVKYNLIID
jgi:hypothetical protein